MVAPMYHSRVSSLVNKIGRIRLTAYVKRMSIQSEAVKKWRKTTKDRIVKAFGGSCAMCGYNRCHESLDLHHIDPNTKDFSMGSIRANPKNWALIVMELRKCALICRNCHGEVHAGLSVIPLTAPRFDEAFATYTRITNKKCRLCDAPVTDFGAFCSSKCSAAYQFRDVVPVNHTCLSCASRVSVKYTRCRPCFITANELENNKKWPPDSELITLRNQMTLKELALLLDVKQTALFKRIKKINTRQVVPEAEIGIAIGR